MSRRNPLRVSWRAAGLALALLAGCASSPGIREARPSDQLQFGVDMAKRGLWSEALFRFEQARRLAPEDPKILNDLAIAYEAVGRFDDAHATYKEALQIDPGAREIKRNYSRFLEFYQSFKPSAGAAPESGTPPPATGGGSR